MKRPSARRFRWDQQSGGWERRKGHPHATSAAAHARSGRPAGHSDPADARFAARNSTAGGKVTTWPALVVALLVAACSGPILANPAPTPRPIPTATPAPTIPVDPIVIELPRDDGPHNRLTEWWYYTGHLTTLDRERRFGFEAVIFRAERGGVPVTWAAHLALTDESGGRFLYAQRNAIGPQVDSSPRDEGGSPTGFDLQVAALDPGGRPLADAPWRLAGADGTDLVDAVTSDPEAALAGARFGLLLDLTTDRPPALHDEIGWLDFGPAGSSYYYSRTRLDATGSVIVDDLTLPVEGTAWFDHQWGDFVSVGGGGWDWFAVNLADGTDLTVSLVRAADGSHPLVYGTLVDRDGTTRHLDRDAFQVEADPDRTWTSRKTGATYPAGWTITVPSERLIIDLEPTIADQELDTRATTGVVYWEGSQVVTATRGGLPVAGEAYVELTGYPPEP